MEPVLGPAKPDPWDHALAGTVIGLFKTKGIRRRGPGRQPAGQPPGQARWLKAHRGLKAHEAVEFATLDWVDWFNHRRLLEPIGNIPPAKAEVRYHAQIAGQTIAA